MDELNQYGRRGNIRIHGVAEENNSKDDGEKVVKEVATALGIQIFDCDLQRAHQIARKKTGKGKPRPLIARFVSFKKRSEIMNNKINLKDNYDFKDVFIGKDQTQLRAKLLWYVKNCCDNEFVSCHNIIGKIRRKRSAWKNDESGSSAKERDPGTGDWIIIISPDNFF